MADNNVTTDLVGEKVLVIISTSGKEKDWFGLIRVVWYGVSGLCAIVEDDKGQLIKVGVTEMKILKEKDFLKDKPKPRPGVTLSEDLRPQKSYK